MTKFQALVIAASFFAPVLVGLFVLVLNYFDNRAAAKELAQKQADAARRTAGSTLALSELSKADREQLNAHIETLEAFANAVRNASAAVDESARHRHRTAAAVASEQRQPS
jgi:uncharacterized protein YlxW (UPF0749 family)